MNPSANRFKYFTRSACPICNLINQRCGQSGTTDLIHCRKTNPNTQIPGYTPVGESSIGFALYKEGEPYGFQQWTDEEKKEWGRQQRQEQDRKQSEVDKRQFELIAQLPPIEQRNRDYLDKINRHPLSQKQVQYLLDRGLTLQDIKRIKPYADRRGIAIPVWNRDGLMVGAQIKPHDGDGYVWGNIGTNWLRETGQLPLAFWGDTVNPSKIILVEGVGFKAYLTSLRFSDCLVIGASGGNFAVSDKELKSALNQYADVPVVLMPDGGAISNRSVIAHYRSTQRLVDGMGVRLGVGWWSQFTKSDGDIDEISADRKVEVITWDKFSDICNNTAKIEQGIWNLGKVSNKRRSLESQHMTGLTRPIYRIYRNTGELSALIESARTDGYKLILDASPCGSGKSTIHGKMSNPGGIEMVMYFQQSHRNPTTLEIEQSFADVPSRHNGLFVNPDKTTPMGNQWLQTTEPKPGEWDRTRSNCHLADYQQAFRETGFDSPDGKNPICGICPHMGICHSSSGDGWGYKYQRLGAMSNARVRISPMAAPSPSSHDYSDTMTIWDDQDITTIRQLTATDDDVRKTIGTLFGADSGLAVELEPLIDRIMTAFETESFRGHDRESLIGGLEFEGVESLLHRVAAIVQPDLSKLGYEGQPETESVLAKWNFTVAPQQKTLLENITPNWLVWLLEVMAGNVRGSISIRGKLMTVKHHDNYHATIISKSAVSIFLNATKSREDLAIELGVEPDKILVISQPVPDYSNLTIHMIDGAGSPTKQRADSKNVSIDKLQLALATIHTSCATIDHIKGVGTRARWFVDSVGSNAFRFDNCLLLIGQPRTNLGAMAEEFSILTGKQVSALDKDPEYQSFLKRRVAGGVIQAVGRPRAQHRTDDIHIYIMCDRDDYPISEMMAAYPGAKLVVDAIEDLCIKSARPRVRLRARFAELLIENPNIKMVIAAAQLGTSQSTIKAMFREYGVGYKKGTSLLYKSLIAKLSILPSDYSDWGTHLSQDVVDNHMAILDDVENTEDAKSVLVATSMEPLTSYQTSALFTAIGRGATEYTIELLKLNLALQIPKPIEELDIKLSETGDDLNDLVDGLKYIVKWSDIPALDVLRDKHHDDKETLQLASKHLSDADRKHLGEMVKLSNVSRELRECAVVV